MIWLHAILEIIIGITLLTWGANRFISACIALASNLGMSPLLIGMLMVGFATSFPEIVVAVIASWHGNPGLAIGNAVGSNIANIGLVLGITALISPLVLNSSLVKREFPIQIIISILVGILLLNHYLSRMDGLILITLLILHMLYWVLFVMPRKGEVADPLVQELTTEIPKTKMKSQIALLWWLLGLVLLFISSELLVKGASTIAKQLGVSDIVIGLTVVAAGTSLPELAATIVSSWRNEPDIAIGNIVGSNIFNLLAVLAMPALIAPTAFSATLLYRDYPIMLGFMLVLWLFAFIPPRKGELGRFKSAILFAGYISYITLLVFTARI